MADKCPPMDFSAKPRMARSKSSTSMGLEMWASIPDSMLRRTSSEKALAVMAMMGMVRPRGFWPVRMARAAS